LWSHLTPWNVLEYKGPTVSARFDELHDLVELGLGTHRRLNELQQKERQKERRSGAGGEGQEAHPDMDYTDVSFWYLVNHLGARFLEEAPRHLPGLRQVTAGLWQASVFSHPLFLVSVRELEVERDSLPLHVLAGVPEAQRGIVTAALKAEPALWPNYGPWLSLCEQAIWQEVLLMASQQQGPPVLDFRPLADYLKQTGDLESMKSLIEAVGANRVVEAVGPEQFWAALSPEQRERLRRLLEHEAPPKNDPT
jgi:hypothetical protein